PCRPGTLPCRCLPPCLPAIDGKLEPVTVLLRTGRRRHSFDVPPAQYRPDETVEPRTPQREGHHGRSRILGPGPRRPGPPGPGGPGRRRAVRRGPPRPGQPAGPRPPGVRAGPRGRGGHPPAELRRDVRGLPGLPTSRL